MKKTVLKCSNDIVFDIIITTQRFSVNAYRVQVCFHPLTLVA